MENLLSFPGSRLPTRRPGLHSIGNSRAFQAGLPSADQSGTLDWILGGAGDLLSGCIDV